MELLRAIPALPVKDIAAAVGFYEERLGFAAGYHDDRFAILTRGDVELHLWAADDDRWKGWTATHAERPIISGAESFLAGTASCRIEVDGIDELYAEYRGTGVLYDSRTSVEHRPWGTREFPALDLERNLLTFYERREAE